MAEKPNQETLSSLLAAVPEGVAIDRYEVHDHTVELFVSWKEPGRNERQCPSCGSPRCVKKDGGAFQTVRHLRSGVFGTLVTFHKPRFRCKECGRTFYVKPTWVMPRMSITVFLFMDIISSLTSTPECILHVARDTLTTPAIVRNAISHIRLGKPQALPETLGIDEFHGRTGTYNRRRHAYDTETYHCIVVDAELGDVIDVLRKATYNDLHRYFMEFPLYKRQRVKYFCTDMRGGFSKVARNCFPNAKICIDMFHVVKLLTEAVGTVRKDAWRCLCADAEKTAMKAEALKKEIKDSQDTDAMEAEAAKAKALEAKARRLRDDASLVKSSQRALITSPYSENTYWNRHEKKHTQRLNDLFTIWPDLKTAHEALMDFYHLEASSPYQIQRAGLSDWLASWKSCDLPPIRQAAASIEKHRRGIENSWRFSKSNGPTEGLNRRIKDIRRLGFGAHDFENFRKRILLACGSSTVKKAAYTVFGEKKKKLDEWNVSSMPIFE